MRVYTSLLVWSLLLTGVAAQNQPSESHQSRTGVIEGRVTLAPKGTPVPHVEILVVELGRNAITNDQGHFRIDGLPGGNYDLVAHIAPVSSQVKTATVLPGETVVLDFDLSITGIKDEITVTARGREEASVHSIQSVSALDSFDLLERAHASLGEVLDRESGVAKRSWGPGSSRPVIRGFDGDRVLVLQNGLPTGSLSSQSGDHGETLDILTLDRVEVVRGPAALLYGSNAIGGVVNAIKRHHQIHQHPHAGLRGYLTGTTGSGNGQAGLASGAEYGLGSWLVWGNGSGQRTGDYSTPLGEVENSKTRNTGTGAGFGRFNERYYVSLDYGYDNRRYGIPFANLFHEQHDHAETTNPHHDEQVDLKVEQNSLRFDVGIEDLGKVADRFRLALGYGDYEHQELEVGPDETHIGTAFDNRLFTYRGVFDLHRRGPFSGSFGFSGSHRNYQATGLEALSPPIDETGFALFALEELDVDILRLQFGGRLEHRGYEPVGLPARSFTGFSGAAGIYLPLWNNGAAVFNYSHAFRAPALEELYNNGPHVGNLAFEIGNPDLLRERTDGIDLSLRHSSKRLTAKASVFYYGIGDFVFLAPTGDFADGLVEARYVQGDARYAGGEADLSLALHPNVWLDLRLDAVDAQLRESGTPLPRIPPLRSSMGLDVRHKGFSFRPSLLAAHRQAATFLTESSTSGYVTFGFSAGYTLARDHLVHFFTFQVSNLGDRLYRNHLSLIKELAPEMGRAVTFGYTARFF